MKKQYENQAMTLHRKLGHLGIRNLQQLPNLSKGLNLKIKNQDFQEKCDVCIMARLQKLPHNQARRRASAPLRLVHTDVCGPITPPTHDGKNYYVIFLDDYTHFCVIYLMERKSETFKCLQQYVSEAENHWEKRVYRIRCDNGTEYKNNTAVEWLTNKGISMEFSSPYCPQQNGKAERMNRTIAERMRGLLFDSRLNPDMWGEAAMTAVHLINRSPSSTVKTLPAEMWYNETQDLSRLELFGSVVYAKSLFYVKKLESRAQQALFVGYGTSGYRLRNEETRRIFMARDVVFTDKLKPQTAYTTGNEIKIIMNDCQMFTESTEETPQHNNSEKPTNNSKNQNEDTLL